MPLKSRAAIAIGRIGSGAYTYRSDLPADTRHTRPVEWLTERPRSAFSQDLLYSFGAFMTVCRIKRNNAEARVAALLVNVGTKTQTLMPAVLAGEATDEFAVADIEDQARGDIRDFIGQRFKGHAMTRLVAAVLRTQGFQVQVAPEGPDGGIDIIAGQGTLGFEGPRLAVQVKSSDTPVEAAVVQQLKGAMSDFAADQGLFVSWGGYKSSMKWREQARLFFNLRLWDDNDLIRAITSCYEALDAEIQAELPLKRIWTLVPPPGEA